VTEGDLRRLARLVPTAFVKEFCRHRLDELKSGVVIDRLDVFEQPGVWQLTIRRKAQGSGNSTEPVGVQR
jgi:hypothetical protein